MVGSRCYRPGMSVRKLSVALDERIAESASRAATAAGMSLSAWLSSAAEHELALERGKENVRAWEREHGAFTDEELRAADAVLDRVLIGRAAKQLTKRQPSAARRATRR